MIGFLIGLLLGAGGMMYLSNLRSKKYKEEKARIEKEYEDKVKSIIEDRDSKVKELENSKKKIEELTDEQAKLRLSLSVQKKIEDTKESTIDSITNSILDEVRKRSK